MITVINKCLTKTIWDTLNFSKMDACKTLKRFDFNLEDNVIELKIYE